MKYVNQFRTWLDARPERRRGALSVLAALLVLLAFAAPALAQTGITFFGGLGVVSDGTAAAPAYTFFGDPDTGLYRIGSGNIGITSNGTNVFDLDSSGNVTIPGILEATAVTINGTYVGITPVATATDIFGGATFTGNVDGVPTLTVGGVRADTGVYTTSVTIAGTPVIPFATRVPHWCGAQSVLGSATMIPATLTAAGITTPRAPVASLGQDITLDGNSVTTGNAGGVVTLKVWQLRTAATLTPQAATTAVTINACVDGN